MSIRGVGSDDVGTNSQPGVALHLDGVFIGRSSGSNAATYDIQRIEVLRGPQGTLYGRNSTGGAINVISKPPDYELSAMGDVRYGDYAEVRLRGAFNVPIVKDKAALRVTLLSEERDGYEDNLYPGGEDAGDADNTYWRAQLLLEPVEKFRVVLRASQYESSAVGPGRKRLPTPADSTTDGASEITEDPDLHTVWKDTAEQQSVDLDLYSLQFDWDLSFATLTGLASTGETDFEWLADGDQTRGQVMDPGGIDFILGAAPIGSDQDLAELRLTSSSTSPFEWLVGVFYFKEDTSTRSRLTDDQLATGRFSGLVDSVLVISNWDIDTTSYAGFGQLSYPFCSASELRQEPSKLDTAIRDLSSPPEQASGTELEVKVLAIEPFKVIAACHVGPNEGQFKTFGTLFHWAEKQGRANDLSGIYGIPIDDIRSVPAAECRFDCCFDLGPEVRPDNGYREALLGGGLYAVARQVGPYEGLEEKYDLLFGVWLTSSGYAVRGAPFYNRYLADPDTLPPEQWETDLYLPIEAVA